MSWLARNGLERGGALAVVVLVVYAWLAPGHIVDTDNAELTTLGAIGGGAHPSGYPLYLLILRALSWLPGSPAHATALATVLIAVALVLVLHAAARAWGASPIAATLACALYAAGPFVMRMHTEAEVFALNGLVGAAVLLLAADKGPARGIRRVGLLALVAGLGIANHLTCVFLAPVGLYGAVRGARESGGWAAAGGIAIAAFVIGLSPYAYLFVTDENLLSWPAPHSLGELWTIIAREEYGAGSIGVAGSTAGSLPSVLVAFAAFTGRSWLWVPPILGAAMFVVRGRGEGRIGWWALAASWLLLGPVLTIIADAPAEGFGLFVLRRYQLLSLVVLAIPIAIGFDEVARRIPALAGRARAGHGLAIAAFVGAAALSLPRVSALHSPAVEQCSRNLLGSLPPAAVVIGEGDDLHVGTRYLQLALGVRPDVTYIHLAGLGSRWYRARIEALGVPIGTISGPGTSTALATQILATGRPVFIASRRMGVLRDLPAYPYGIVLRVLPKGAALPSLDEVVALNQRLYGRFDLSAPKPGPDDELAVDVAARYAVTWQMLAAALRAARRPDDAAAAAELARQLGP